MRGRRLLLAMACVLAGVMPAAFAQQDARVVRIVVPAPAGGSLDATARLVAQRMAALTGEPHVVENRPGANTIIGVEHVVQSPADGHTLLFAGNSLVINPLLQKVSYSPFDDLRPIAAMAIERYALIASTSLKLGSVRELEPLARARPGGLNCAAGPGVMGLGCEQLRQRFGGAVTSVPYPGIAPGLVAVAGGHVDLMFVPLEQAARLIDGKQAQLLALSSRGSAIDRSDFVAPLAQELWPDILMEATLGLYAPARTPEERVRRIEADVARLMSQPELPAALRKLGLEPIAGSTPESFTALLRGQQSAFARLIGKLGLGVR